MEPGKIRVGRVKRKGKYPNYTDKNGNVYSVVPIVSYSSSRSLSPFYLTDEEDRKDTV